MKGREIARSDEAKYFEEIKKTGNNVVTELTPAQKKGFQDATLSVWDLVKEKVGADLIKSLKEELAKAPD